MKIHNGCWLLKEGYAVFGPKEVYDLRVKEDAVELLAPARHIDNKGATLEGATLTIRITTPFPEIIRVEAVHHRGSLRNSPKFELNLPSAPIDYEETADILTIRSGHLSLVIDRRNWNMRYERDGKLLTESVENDLAYIKENWTGHAYDNPGKKAYMGQQLSLSVDELVYGTGERFTPFVKNGQSITIWNEDGGTSTDQSYKNIPFYLSNRGYGVFVNHPERVEFEIATEQVTKAGFSVEGEYLDYFLINGPTMKEVLSRYTDLTGKPSLPPQWTFGLWLSTSFTTDYDEKTVMSFIDGMFERGIPISVFHFDCFWMKEFHWSDLIWNEKIFPDPEGMLSRIHAKGVKVCVWINSFVAQESTLFEEGMEQGYFLKRKNGDVWQWDMWQPGLAIIDFTNPEAVAWYQSKLEALLDMGVDCFKTDLGERVPTDCVYHNGADPEKMHNYYTYLYNKAVYEVIVRKKGREEAVLFARSATVGGQKFPVHWGGDCWSDYVSMEESLRGGLSLTSSGFGYWSHDIGGFERTSTPDVYKRWAAFGLLSTHSRLHGSSSYRVPWNYDEESVEVVRFFTNLKLRLLPYLYSSAVSTSRTGIPMIRSMALEYEGDMNCRYLDKQYMLGDSLLVAPIFQEDGTANYYLPEGLWTNVLTGETVEGGVWRKEKHDYLSIPLWARENTILPVGIRTENASYKFHDNLGFMLYGLKKEARSTVYQNGEIIAELAAVKEESGVSGTFHGRGSAVITLAESGKSITISEGKWEIAF